MTAAEVDPASHVPPYEQLREQLTRLVLGGGLAPGERLPSIRQLAADLGLANGTVARAYRELEGAGLLVTDRRRGTAVAARSAGQGADQALDAARRAALQEAAARYAVAVRQLGAAAEDALGAVRRALA